MAPFTLQENVQCYFWIAKFGFPIAVQLRSPEKFCRDPPHRHSCALAPVSSIYWNVEVSTYTEQAIEG